MRIGLLLGLALISAGGVAASSGAKVARGGESDPQVAGGGALFGALDCGACHGHVGQGTNAGPRLAGRDFSLKAFTYQLRRPMEEMPPYSEKVLDDAQVAQLHAYVSTLK